MCFEVQCIEREDCIVIWNAAMLCFEVHCIEIDNCIVIWNTVLLCFEVHCIERVDCIVIWTTSSRALSHYTQHKSPMATPNLFRQRVLFLDA